MDWLVYSEGNIRLYIYSKKVKLIGNQLGSSYTYFGINSDGSAWFLICTSLISQQETIFVVNFGTISPHFHAQGRKWSGICLVLRIGTSGITPYNAAVILICNSIISQQVGLWAAGGCWGRGRVVTTANHPMRKNAQRLALPWAKAIALLRPLSWLLTRVYASCRSQTVTVTAQVNAGIYCRVLVPAKSMATSSFCG